MCCSRETNYTELGDLGNSISRRKKQRMCPTACSFAAEFWQEVAVVRVMRARIGKGEHKPCPHTRVLFTICFEGPNIALHTQDSATQTLSNNHYTRHANLSPCKISSACERHIDAKGHTRFVISSPHVIQPIIMSYNLPSSYSSQQRSHPCRPFRKNTAEAEGGVS